MQRIAEFKKVSKTQFISDFEDTFNTDGNEAYENPSLPLCNINLI